LEGAEVREGCHPSFRLCTLSTATATVEEAESVLLDTSSNRHHLPPTITITATTCRPWHSITPCRTGFPHPYGKVALPLIPSHIRGCSKALPSTRVTTWPPALPHPRHCPRTPLSPLLPRTDSTTRAGQHASSPKHPHNPIRPSTLPCRPSRLPLHTPRYLHHRLHRSHRTPQGWGKGQAPNRSLSAGSAQSCEEAEIKDSDAQPCSEPPGGDTEAEHKREEGKKRGRTDADVSKWPPHEEESFKRGKEEVTQPVLFSHRLSSQVERCLRGNCLSAVAKLPLRSENVLISPSYCPVR
ncbi:hypothetical protein GOODEAATRI_018863, partial [Goodea atripinnis]